VIADVAGIPMSSHLYPEVSGYLLRVTPTRHWLEWQDWAHPVLAHPSEIRSGELFLFARREHGAAGHEVLRLSAGGVCYQRNQDSWVAARS
jgi:mandelate racemase